MNDLTTLENCLVTSPEVGPKHTMMQPFCSYIYGAGKSRFTVVVERSDTIISK